MTMNVLGICGSLRKASTNRLLLRAAIATAPAGMTITEADISGVPLYDGDVEPSPPAAVTALRDQAVSYTHLTLPTKA